ncbi:uncharacterized protein PAF06_001776 isoform 1-T1 [Gastrophryne carolinensis]
MALSPSHSQADARAHGRGLGFPATDIYSPLLFSPQAVVDQDLARNDVAVGTPGWRADGAGPSSSSGGSAVPGSAAAAGRPAVSGSLGQSGLATQGSEQQAGGPSGGIVRQESACSVLIVGHSFIFWSARRAEVRRSGKQLGIPEDRARLHWAGVRGMCWEALREHTLRVAARTRPPGVLVLHAGGNDLGRVPMRRLIKSMTRDLLFFLGFFPGVVLVWSHIVPRFVWRHARDSLALEKVRVKVNKAMARFVRLNGGLSVRHVDVEGMRGFFRSDGVHLNEMGNDLFNLALRERIEMAVELWRARRR